MGHRISAFLYDISTAPRPIYEVNPSFSLPSPPPPPPPNPPKLAAADHQIQQPHGPMYPKKSSIVAGRGRGARAGQTRGAPPSCLVGGCAEKRRLRPGPLGRPPGVMRGSPLCPRPGTVNITDRLPPGIPALQRVGEGASEGEATVRGDGCRQLKAPLRNEGAGWRTKVHLHPYIEVSSSDNE